MYARTMSNPSNSLDTFSWKILGLLQTPICSFWYSYLPHDSTIVQKCLDPGDNYIWWYPIFKSKDDAYVKPSMFSSIFFILVIGKGFLRILWFSFLKLDKNCTVPFFFKWKWGISTLNNSPFFLTLSSTAILLPYGKRLCVHVAPGMV